MSTAQLGAHTPVVYDAVDELQLALVDLECSPATGERARALILRFGDRWMHSGASPSAIAAGAIYLAGLERNDKCTQRSVADAVGCSAPTVRRRYKPMYEALYGDEGGATDTAGRVGRLRNRIPAWLRRGSR
jgi:transcription initiation factor TFIIIB Brf1 subunit/transcription initiation factor TFIIB